MKPESYLSKLLLVLSLAASVAVFVLLPSILQDSAGDDIRVMTLRNVWEEQGTALPWITESAIAFSDSKVVRYVFFSLFFV